MSSIYIYSKCSKTAFPNITISFETRRKIDHKTNRKSTNFTHNKNLTLSEIDYGPTYIYMNEVERILFEFWT